MFLCVALTKGGKNLIKFVVLFYHRKHWTFEVLSCRDFFFPLECLKWDGRMLWLDIVTAGFSKRLATSSDLTRSSFSIITVVIHQSSKYYVFISIFVF